VCVGWIALGGGAPPTVCLPVANDLFPRVFGSVETIEDLLASPSPCSHEDLDVYWDTLSWRHLLRNRHVDFYPCPKLVFFFVTKPSNFERASELAIKVFTSSRCYLHWYLLNVESALMARFWKVSTLLIAWHRWNTWVFGSKWWKHAELQKLGLALILLCSMLIGLLEDLQVSGC
jgi:hypothetical protein